MPRNNCEPAVTPLDPSSDDTRCRKCGTALEPIENSVEGLLLEHLQLCPCCYLVVWRDQDGFQIRQSVPMKDSVDREAS